MIERRGGGFSRKMMRKMSNLFSRMYSVFDQFAKAFEF